ncbi:MAG: hypothetical protein KDC53_12080, partial [Saprospiraceae bacterium]|nr:hypothetical protein [Saprospiraceae bacterium]
MNPAIINGTSVSFGTNSVLNAKFATYQAYELDMGQIYSQVNSPSFNDEMEISLGNNKFSIHIYPYDIRHPDYKLQISTDAGIEELDPGPSYTYRGWNIDDPSKEVRLTITPTYIAGFITDIKGITWYMQPVADFGETNLEAMVLYKGIDELNGEPHTCATDPTTHGVYMPEPAEASHSRANSCVQADVAIAADYSMYTKYGKNAASLAQHLLDIKNLMDPNYDTYNVQFRVVTTLIETVSGKEGWSTSVDPGTLLNSYCCWAGTGSSSQLGCTGNNGFGVTHDVGELWTNRDFTGSTVGIAWLGTICNSMFRYSTNQHFTTSLQSLRSLIAHETGHNFGASHAASGTPYIMAPSVNPNATTWSAASQTSINSLLPAFSCLGSCGQQNGNCTSSITVTSSNATGNKQASSSINT